MQVQVRFFASVREKLRRSEASCALPDGATVGMLQKKLDGFGELFRMLSYEQIGSAAMMSRACAGLVAGRIVIALPGSEAAVRLAVEKLIVPELGHLVQLASK